MKLSGVFFAASFAYVQEERTHWGIFISSQENYQRLKFPRRRHEQDGLHMIAQIRWSIIGAKKERKLGDQVLVMKY